MDRIFKYTLRRGLLVTTVLHPLFKALLLLYNYEISSQTQIDISLAPTGLRWLVPVRFKLSFVNDELNVSIHFFWSWIEKLYGRLSMRSGGVPLDSQVLKNLLAIYPGGRNLPSVPKSQVLALIFVSSAAPALLAVAFYPFRLIWIILRSLSATLRTAVRPIPALLAILVIMFATGDAWRMFGLEPLLRIVLLVTLVLGLSLVAVFLGMRGHDGNWRTLIGYPSGGSRVLHSWGEKTPAKRLIDSGVQPLLPLDDPDKPESSSNAPHIPNLEWNISLVYRFTIVVHVIAVAFWLSISFIVIGIIVVSRSMTKALSDRPAIVIFHQHVFGQDFLLTKQLVLLSTTLGCVAALTFATSTLQSSEGRKVFADYALLDLRKTLGALAYYFGAAGALLIELRNRGVLDELRKNDKESMTSLLDLVEKLADPSS
jgi:hypothetical protein